MQACNIPYHQEYSREIALCDSPSSVLAHKGIFNLREEAYVLCSKPESLIIKIGELISGSNTSPDGSPIRLHVVIEWENLLRLILWSSESLSVSRVYMLLTEAGMSRKDIEPFLKSPLSDIFPSLYYSKKLDVLRRLCTKAKRTIESRIEGNKAKIDCHLTSKDTQIIAASSL